MSTPKDRSRRSILGADGGIDVGFLSEEIKNTLDGGKKDGQAQPVRFTNKEVGGAIAFLGLAFVVIGRSIANEPEPKKDDTDSNDQRST